MQANVKLIYPVVTSQKLSNKVSTLAYRHVLKQAVFIFDRLLKIVKSESLHDVFIKCT